MKKILLATTVMLGTTFTSNAISAPFDGSYAGVQTGAVLGKTVTVRATAPLFQQGDLVMLA